MMAYTAVEMISRDDLSSRHLLKYLREDAAVEKMPQWRRCRSGVAER